MFRSVVLLLASVLIFGCSSTPKVVLEASLDKGVKYEVSDINLDIVQRYNRIGMFTTKQMQQIMTDHLKYSLDKRGLLATPSDKNVAKLDITMSYRRMYVGDDTPFAMGRLANPRVHYYFKVYKGTLLAATFNSKHLTASFSFKGDMADVQSTQNVEHDISYSLSVVNHLIKNVERQTPGYQANSNDHILSLEYKKDLFKKVDEIYASNMNTDFLSSDYIPTTIINDFLLGINNESYDVRTETYKEITKNWLNSERLFDQIKSTLNAKKSMSLDKKGKREVELALEALASSGNMNYIDYLKELSNESKTEKMREYASKNIEFLKERAATAVYIHRAPPKGIDLDWKERQLYAMVASDDINLQAKAVRLIYKHYPKNAALLEVLSKSLDGSSQYVFRAKLSRDYHAWVCRVLGLSGDAQYLAQLQDVAQHAYYEKVREYAETFAEELEDSIDS